jgi:hypothetical protein
MSETAIENTRQQVDDLRSESEQSARSVEEIATLRRRVRSLQMELKLGDTTDYFPRSPDGENLN